MYIAWGWLATPVYQHWIKKSQKNLFDLTYLKATFLFGTNCKSDKGEKFGDFDIRAFD